MRLTRINTRGIRKRSTNATLSVCCLANSSGPFLRAALGPLREIADEVVIAAGGPVSDEDLRCYGEVADRLFSIEFEFIERHLAWLHAQCHGDWLLRLDGDEIPSPEMVSEVLAAKNDGRLGSVLFARRHPFPDIESFIVQEPWYPDFQVRMIRNDGSLRFAGLQHTSAERTLPARMSEAPLYHLSLMASLQDRSARAERYEKLRPGLIAPSGLPINDFYFPERLQDVDTAPVPRAHKDQLERVLAASGPPSARRSAEAVHVTLGEMDVYWGGRSLTESAYQAAISLIGTLLPLAPGERRPVYFRVHNGGSETWSWDPSVGPYIHVVHRLLDENRVPLEDWRPSFFTEWVEPGMTTTVAGYVDAPANPGRYLLDVTLRHAPERLFGEPAECEIVVRPGGVWKR